MHPKARTIQVILVVLQLIAFLFLVFGRTVFLFQNTLIALLLLTFCVTVFRLYHSFKNGYYQKQ
jgi:hypothetical protein